MGPFSVTEEVHTGFGVDNPHLIHIIHVIKSGTILMEHHGNFCVRGELHTGFWWGFPSPYTYNSVDKFRNNFNGQAWEHFGLEERYIEDLVGNSLTHICYSRDKIRNNCNGKAWDHFG
jgi:hypothetical protein